jgi:putative flippase GtrA
MEFDWAVFLSYFIGMPVALLLYRLFVFQSRDAGVIRQFILFSFTYFGFLPLTWTLSVVSESGFEVLLPTTRAQLAAHTIGVIGPVVLNFAYNKFITFCERFKAG